jgi:general nucleoside transport system ATP-binding protein
LSRRPLVFVLADQPTRGLDVGAIDSVASRLREAQARGVGILLISSELDELLALSDRVLVLYRGKIVADRPVAAASRESLGTLMAGGAA